ncbi:zinc finger protein 271-like isoform X1 [Artemia franciscana]|uniref:C2H2-type domain-containing protein n=1 Tax=Artemia franciscana TaxID=6661 RepID=A0AA88L6U9_ARTSF|nr:hypothetical protein QYM36_004840 [Artemia franciscana]
MNTANFSNQATVKQEFEDEILTNYGQLHEVTDPHRSGEQENNLSAIYPILSIKLENDPNPLKAESTTINDEEVEDEISADYEQLSEVADPLLSPKQGNNLSAKNLRSCTKLEHDPSLLKVESPIINEQEAEDEIPVVYEQLCEIADPLPSPSQGNGLSANIIKSCTKLEHDPNLLKVESAIINDECLQTDLLLCKKESTNENDVLNSSCPPSGYTEPEIRPVSEIVVPHPVHIYIDEKYSSFQEFNMDTIPLRNNLNNIQPRVLVKAIPMIMLPELTSRHIDEVTNGIWRCDLCGKIENCFLMLDLHQNTGCEKLSPIECDICPAVIKDYSDFVTHFVEHQLGKTRKCPICLHEKIGDIKQHLEGHFSYNSPRFESFLNLPLASRRFYLNPSGRHDSSTKDHNLSTKDTKKQYSISPFVHNSSEDPQKPKTFNKSLPNQSSVKRQSTLSSSVNPYQCEICKKIFSSVNSLNVHSRLHSGEKPYVCKICNKKFAQKSNLIFHLRSHSGEKPYGCKVCNKKFSSRYYLAYHMRLHSGELPYQCKTCYKRFALRSCLTSHMRMHTGERSYKCKVCTKSFSQNSHLIVHMRFHFGEKPFVCKFCSKKFSQKYNLNDHMRVHTGEKPYKCQACNKRFAQKSNFIRHLRSHSGEKPYGCKICDKKFAYRSYLSHHMRLHSGEMPYQCKICNKKYASRSYLSIHMRLHSGERPYECKICNKIFSQNGSLIIHMRLHSGEKPYECKICNKKFNQKCHLTDHFGSHSGEKSFDCNVCTKKFSLKSSLSKHKRLHDGERLYKCEVCDKSFSQNSNLVVHLRLHSGEKPFDCNICNKKFTQKSTLTYHFRSHSGEKPYDCKVCSKKFSSRSYLTTHMRLHKDDKRYECKI